MPTTIAKYREHERLREALYLRGITLKELAGGVGLSAGTVYNVSSGASTSRRARRKIQQFLGVLIWNDLPLKRHVFFDPDVEIESPTVEGAIEFARQFPRGLAERDGKIVRFTKRFCVGYDEARCESSAPPHGNLIKDSGDATRGSSTQPTESPQ